MALAEKTHCKLQLHDDILGMLKTTLFSIFTQAETKIKNQGRGRKRHTHSFQQMG